MALLPCLCVLCAPMYGLFYACETNNETGHYISKYGDLLLLSDCTCILQQKLSTFGEKRVKNTTVWGITPPPSIAPFCDRFAVINILRWRGVLTSPTCIPKIDLFVSAEREKKEIDKLPCLRAC